MASGHQYSLLNPLMYPGIPGTASAAMMPPGSMMMGGHAGGLVPPMMYTAEQLMWMQQSYAQYMAHYMQYYQPGFYQQQIPVPPNEQVPNIPANQPPVDPVRVEAAANERPPRPEIVRMNAQGGPLANDDDDDEMRNRDWLDWVYTFIRFMLLLCILYFYSSFDRFIATLSLVVVIYLYQAGWFRLQQRNVAAAEPQPPRGVQEQPREHPNDREGDGRPDANDDEQAAADEVNNGAVPAAPEAQRHGLLSLGWTFIVSFFSSLAPQPPAPVNAN